MSLQKQLRKLVRSGHLPDIGTEAADELDRLNKLTQDQFDQLNEMDAIEANCAKAKARVVELSHEVASQCEEISEYESTLLKQAETIRVLTVDISESFADGWVAHWRTGLTGDIALAGADLIERGRAADNRAVIAFTGHPDECMHNITDEKGDD